MGLADAFIRVQAFGNPGQSGGMRRVCHRRGCRNALLGVGLMPRYGSEKGSEGHTMDVIVFRRYKVDRYFFNLLEFFARFA